MRETLDMLEMAERGNPGKAPLSCNLVTRKGYEEVSLVPTLKPHLRSNSALVSMDPVVTGCAGSVLKATMQCHMRKKMRPARAMVSLPIYVFPCDLVQ